jgi:AP endonuclease-1
MPRRANHGIETEESIIGSAQNVLTPKKGRKSAKIEATEVIAEVEQTLVTKSSKKKVKAEIDSYEEVLTTPKRKAKTEDDEDGAAEKKATKKRKTKEEKEAEAMPLAARTVVGTLKKALYIGAHVSGAGGKTA